MDEIEIKGKATPEEIAAWKEKYGTVHEITVENKRAYLKKLTRQSLSLALTFLGRDMVKFAETVFENNFIGGEKDMIDDTDYLPGVIEECTMIVNGVKSSYVKH